MACMCVAPAAAGLGARVSLAPRRARASVRVMAKKPKFNAPEISLPAVDLDAEQLEVYKTAVAEKAQAAVSAASTAWEDVEDKPAAVALGFAGVLALYTSLTVLNTIDSLPLVGGFFELVGLGASTYFAYLYINPDTRAELVAGAKKTLSEMSLK